MRKYLSVFALAIVMSESVFSQCIVTESALPDIIVCGDCAELSANGRGQGQVVFQEDFNTGAPNGWFFTQQGRFDNPCSPSGVDGTTHIWMGNTSAVPRTLQTIPYNFSTATSGVSICFDMLFSTQGVNAPCEGPDEPDEGVYLQYRIGNGQWVTIHYFDPNGGGDPQLVNWNNWCFQLPQAAATGNVSIRWFQDNDSGADYDHWGIDNVVIYFNDPTYAITWTHDGYSIPAPGGVNPTPVCPQSTTEYPVVMTNGTSVCHDTVRIIVESPEVIVDAGNDTTICSGQCVTLDGTAKVIRSPGGPKTYFTFEPDTITSVFGNLVPGEVNINVARLNMTNLTATNSILTVCIDSAAAYDQVLFPGLPPLIPPVILDYNLSQFSFELICPDGTVVTLIPSGALDTTSNDLSGTCFVPAGGANLSSSIEPYSGNFNSGQPLSNFNGCTANGIWSLRITSIFGQAIIKGWSITFNDIEINYNADFSWNPTTSMTNSNTLTPTVCSPITQTYTLFAQDTAGCIFESDVVTVNVTPNCCNLSFTGTTINSTSCTSANGSINLIIDSGSGNYQFLWSDNDTNQNRGGLGGGTYSVTVIDVTQNCQRDSSFTITDPNPPQITNISLTHETCSGDSDGTADVSVTGGTGTLIYTWSTGQTGPSIIGIPPGDHSVTVTDMNSCFDSDTITIDPGVNCCILQVASITVNPNCGLSDGSIDLTITGSGNYVFVWSNLESTQNISNLSAGSYSVTVLDVNQNCDHDTTINLSNSNTNSPLIDTIFTSPETCAGDSSGTATVITSGGNGALTYQWSNNDTAASITGLIPDNYAVTVSDTLGCQAVGNVSVPAGQICCNLISSSTKTDASCNISDGSIIIVVDPATGTAPFEFSIDSINFLGNNVFNGLAPGTYYPTVRDVNSCLHTDTILIVEASNSITITLQGTDISCFGDDDGIAQVDTSGGDSPLSILWSNGGTSKTIVNLPAGVYGVTVTDQSSCERIDSVNISEPSELVVNLGGPVDFCTLDSAMINAGNFSQYIWSTGDSMSSIIVTQSGSYTVTVYDAGGCSVEGTVMVSVNPLPTVDAGLDSNIYDFESVLFSPSTSGIVNTAGFEWSPDHELSCTLCQNPVASPDSTSWYYVSYTDLNGCSGMDSILIGVENGSFYAVIPNAFSPNGDGINDVLYVYHEGVERLVFRVYNRWGSLVFETQSLNTGWDGTFKGKPLNPDVFIYELYAEFFNFETKPKRTKGSVTLLHYVISY